MIVVGIALGIALLVIAVGAVSLFWLAGERERLMDENERLKRG